MRGESRRPGSDLTFAARPGRTREVRRLSRLAQASYPLCYKVKAFLDRPIEGDWPYLWIDATYLKVRRGGRIVSVAAIMAVGVNADGRRKVLGMDNVQWCIRRPVLDGCAWDAHERRRGQDTGDHETSDGIEQRRPKWHWSTFVGIVASLGFWTELSSLIYLKLPACSRERERCRRRRCSADWFRLVAQRKANNSLAIATRLGQLTQRIRKPDQHRGSRRSRILETDQRVG